LAPAIAAGCPAVLKPASATPLTAIAFARRLEEAGLPPGWVNVVTVPGRVADHLVTHPDVSMVTFTGSPEVGWSIRAKASRVRVSLELGNNAPVIIEPDADLDHAADRIVACGYSYSGQSCISVQRIYAHRTVHDRLRDAICDRVAELKAGPPDDEAGDVSALITAKDTERVQGWVEDAATDGASVLVGGKRDDAGVLQPTVLDGIGPDMLVSRNEVFGPVVGLAAYDDLDDAFAWANDTRYGLQAGIFTSSLATALRAGEVLRFGGVTVNEVPTFRADQMPYGGVKDSGNTREGPAYTYEEMTERRLVIMRP
jgi:acyl-CoA reductase-like NAD-dependent aldehyde dehydrogenase